MAGGSGAGGQTFNDVFVVDPSDLLDNHADLAPPDISPKPESTSTTTASVASPEDRDLAEQLFVDNLERFVQSGTPLVAAASAALKELSSSGCVGGALAWRRVVADAATTTDTLAAPTAPSPRNGFSAVVLGDKVCACVCERETEKHQALSHCERRRV